MGSLFGLIRARRAPDRHRVLIRTDKRDWTWAELDDASARIATLLTGELGLRAGNRVAAQLEKSVESLALYLACLRADLVYLPMNPAYRRNEVEYLLGDAEPRALVLDPGAAAFDARETLAFRAAHVLTLDASGKGSLVERAATGVAGRAADATSAPPTSATASPATPARATPAPTAPSPGVDPTPACIVYTSGTTGKPKGAVLTHGNLVTNALDLEQIWAFTERDALIHALPLFHVHGLFVALHVALLSGARLLWMPKFDDASILRRIPEATSLMGVPTFYTRLLANPRLDAGLCRGMRVFISGSAPLLPETFREFRARTGHVILERYGMTETGMIASNPIDPARRREGSVGLPLPSVQVRISTGDRSAEGIGGVEVKGPGIFGGYWRRPERRADDFTDDGWFRTGDQGVLDADGYLTLVGRAKDLIISGGYNVYPKELELLLDSQPGVAESAVIGVPHPDFGEGVVAVVRPSAAGVDEGLEARLIAAARERIASYKAPKRVVVLAPGEELPRNAMGKVQKNVLRERYQTLFAS